MTPGLPVESDQGVLPIACASCEKAFTSCGMHETTYQRPRIQEGNSVTQRRRHRDTEVALPRDEKFDRILQEICEAPSGCLLRNLLCKEDICSNGSTLPHYIAARGRLGTVLLEVMHFSTSHGYSIDTIDNDGFTALHIAVQYDRLENVNILLTAGAQFDILNPYGELPLHVAIISSKDPDLVEKLSLRYGNDMEMPILGSSKRAGQTALDLVIERALREVPRYGDAIFTPNIHRILSAILLKSTGDLESTEYLENHARINHTPLERATMAMGQLKPLGAQRLAITMCSAVRAECRRHGGGYCYGAHYDRLIPSAWKSSNRATFEPVPTVPIFFPSRLDSQ